MAEGYTASHLIFERFTELLACDATQLLTHVSALIQLVHKAFGGFFVDARRHLSDQDTLEYVDAFFERCHVRLHLFLLAGIGRRLCILSLLQVLVLLEQLCVVVYELVARRLRVLLVQATCITLSAHVFKVAVERL